MLFYLCLLHLFHFFWQMKICDQFTWSFALFLSQFPWFILTLVSSLYSHRSYGFQWFRSIRIFVSALPFSKTLRGLLFSLGQEKLFELQIDVGILKSSAAFFFLVAHYIFLLSPKFKSKCIVYFRRKHQPKELIGLMLAEVLPSRKINFVGISRQYSKLVSTGLSGFLVAKDPHDCYWALNFLTVIIQSNILGFPAVTALWYFYKKAT